MFVEKHPKLGKNICFCKYSETGYLCLQTIYNSPLNVNTGFLIIRFLRN